MHFSESFLDKPYNHEKTDIIESYRIKSDLQQKQTIYRKPRQIKMSLPHIIYNRYNILIRCKMTIF